MNFAQLRAFHAVASEGGFTRAATKLRVSQPTLSGQVKALETGFGVELFDRRGRRIRPTELGEALYAVSRRIFGLVEEADQLLSEARGLARGYLRVGADAPFHVIAALGAFNRCFPGIKLTVSIGNTETLLRDLMDHRIDVAILANLSPDGRLHAVPLREDRLVLFVDRSHPWARRKSVPIGSLAGQRMVLREEGSTTRRSFETALTRAGVALGEVLELGSREAVREAVSAGLGIGVVSLSEFGSDRLLHRIEVSDADLTSVEYVACLAERRGLRLIRAFLDLIEPKGVKVPKRS